MYSLSPWFQEIDVVLQETCKLFVTVALLLLAVGMLAWYLIVCTEWCKAAYEVLVKKHDYCDVSIDEMMDSQPHQLPQKLTRKMRAIKIAAPWDFIEDPSATKCHQECCAHLTTDNETR